ncbi:TetR family transcriptional regulator [Streptomonospora sp. S1-112]|uniref:TetR family transcriptional regulator n=1 Tax=Streptomonospora mangrovi TaxID=2883123 RepID=A0A9X3NGK7_9ACTN|nr:TetR family transcriptional regulator [Streptomonospora mangrovi]MDA0563042.1 TetR family transcriptional regulator [Streptomonospora mangrovi]
MAVQAPIGVRSRSQNQRRKRIVQTAAALALRGGVEAMQMRAVAERAGVALGTLYRYFPSKMDLVVAVVTEELDLLERSISRRPPGAETAAGRAVDVLMRATRGLMREPELADALVRSLIMAEVKTELGPRITDLLWRVATETPVPLHDGDPAEPAAHPDREDPAYVRVASLSSIWIFELLEVLKGDRDIERVRERLEIAAGPLLAVCDEAPVPEARKPEETQN